MSVIALRPLPMRDLSASNFSRHRDEIFARTDRMFAWLMGLQYVLAIVLAFVISPRTWSGAASQTHPHVLLAISLGAALASYPIFLAIRNPGAAHTRYVIAVAQALFSILLIHLTDGRVETHFHIFGSLAFLAIYRDWRVLVAASLVVAADHVVRGLWFPASIYGVNAGAEWRFLEHAGWVLFEDAFLIVACLTGVREMRSMAERQAELEIANGRIERTSAEIRHALHASQALSAEISLDRLVTGVSEFLLSMAGVDSVRVALPVEGAEDWTLYGTDASVRRSLSLTSSEHESSVPVGAFREATGTREPLLVEATRKPERWAGDPYFSDRHEGSLLLVPVTSHGELRAVLLLESRGESVFTPERLDAVRLIGGQFAVSVENAILYAGLEQRIQDRTRELSETQAELVSTARRAGMAEIATNVLHNVGNVLNSINVSAGVVGGMVRKSKSPGLSKVVALMNDHGDDLGEYLTQDAKGKQLPEYLTKLSGALAGEQASLLEEMEGLTKSIDHIKEIVSTQQAYAGVSTVLERVRLRDLVEDALRMNAAALTRHEVLIHRDFADVPVWAVDKHRVLLILVNLISNAKGATSRLVLRPREMTLRIEMASPDAIWISVSDNGEGIPAENLERIFAHGFTTRKDGHGFGLHSCVIAAQEMGGELRVESEGRDRGATFILELPRLGISDPGVESRK